MSFPSFLRTSAFALGLVISAGLGQAHEYPTRGFKLIHPWAEPTEPGAVEAAVYFSVEEVNSDDRLIGAVTPYAEKVELRGGDGQPLDAVPVGPGEALEFTPGRPHMVLRGLKQPLQYGRSYMMTMRFEKAGPILVMVSVGAH